MDPGGLGREGPLNLAYLVAALASVFYGSADFYGGLGARRDSALVVTLGAAIAGLPALLAGLIILGGRPTPADLLWGVMAGATGGVAAALIFRAIAIGPVSVASPVLALTGMSLPVIVGFALGDRPSPLALLGLALAVVAIAWLAAWFLVRRKPLWPRRDARPAAIGSGVLDSFANASYLFAVQHGSLALVAALASLGPATTVLLARAMFGERWSVPQRWGLACAIAAAVCITVG